jgi:hypothetical protein
MDGRQDMNTWLPPVHVQALSRKGEAAPSGQALLYGFFISKGEGYFPGGQANISLQIAHPQSPIRK